MAATNSLGRSRRGEAMAECARTWCENVARESEIEREREKRAYLLSTFNVCGH